MDSTNTEFGTGWFIILIFLFFIGFGGGNFFNSNRNIAIDQTDRDVLTTSAQTQQSILQQGYQNQIGTMQSSYQTLLGFKDMQAQMAQQCCDLKAVVIQQSQLTRDLINSNKILDLEARLATANDALATEYQTNNILSVLAPRTPETVWYEMYKASHPVSVATTGSASNS